MMKKKPEMKVTYTYIEPKTKEEKDSQMDGMYRAFDVLFDETLRRMESEGYAPELLDKFRL